MKRSEYKCCSAVEDFGLVTRFTKFYTFNFLCAGNIIQQANPNPKPPGINVHINADDTQLYLQYLYINQRKESSQSHLKENLKPKSTSSPS